MIDKCKFATNNNSQNTRSIGIGVRGLADLFIDLALPYESKEARKLNKLIFEHLYYYALSYSSDLAYINGPYKFYKDSPVYNGILHIDYYKKVELTLDWESLRSKIKNNGLRNSLLIALMPTASTSQITSTTESFEPITQLTYVKQLISGNFQYIHPSLIKFLPDYKNNIKDIIINRGSLQNLNIDKNIKDIFKTVYEIPQSVIIDMAIDRAPFIDQSQSLNLYFQTTDSKMITALMIKAWKGKLKTGCYYTRVSLLSPPKQYVTSDDTKKNLCSPDCDSCSA